MGDGPLTMVIGPERPHHFGPSGTTAYTRVVKKIRRLPLVFPYKKPHVNESCMVRLHGYFAA